MVFFRNIFQLRGVGSSGSPKLYAKYWWPLFLALKTRPFLAKNDIFIPNCTEEGGSTGLGNIFGLIYLELGSGHQEGVTEIIND